MKPPLPPHISMSRIDQAVTLAFGPTKGTATEAKAARNVAMYLARELTRHSLHWIGENYGGGLHHTTVLYGIRRVEAWRRESPVMDQILTEVTRKIESGEPLREGEPAMDLARIKSAINLEQLAEAIAERVAEKLAAKLNLARGAHA